ncbi:hypothetical protein GIB67_036631 [Kingdonia uniflora]|uniref:Tower domain-containing protein n=1 Tax=Kingdonia uniflora TaxID=39325 RepID=A0A7J7LWH7_9MAGN|nr:hypothetical protein GIB67_036631 [Kingdonia uniflora]
MQTWQIFSDAGNNHRWVKSGGEESKIEPKQSFKTLIRLENPNSPRLPSIADLLHQGSSKLLENNGGNNESVSMFRTGSGKSVPVKESSISKALSVLGEDGGTNGGSSKLVENNGGGGQSFSMFKTGSGKSVSARQSSITKALSVLGEEGVANGGSSKLMHNNGGNKSSQMFQTALGKQFSVKQSLVVKALSVLGEEDVTDGGPVLTVDSGCSFSNSFFQSGSGKMVNVSSAGLIRAKKLLGIDDNSNQFVDEELDVFGKSAHFEKSGKGCLTDMYTSGYHSKEVLPNVSGSETCKVAHKPPPIMFQSAGGRSISVSNDALQRARSLLGDTELGSSVNEGSESSPLFSFHKDNSRDPASSNKENDPYVSSLLKDPSKSKITTKSCPLPKVPFFKQKKSSTSLQALNSRCNLLKQFDENEPMSIDSSMTPLGRSSGWPLVDISNKVGAASTGHNFTNEKRRLGRQNSISPFKRPRSSGFSTPMKTSFPFPSHGQTDKISTLKTHEDSGFRRKVFARYPFQVQRMAVREFFGGPPSHPDVMENISDKVRYMIADSAETYIFDDASGLDNIGSESFRLMLAQSGASLQYASTEWVKNHYKWIVWKLACYERGYSAKGTWRYLTVSNVREELKYRYEREVNHGHRSALRRILEGDASPTSMVVLCISAIRSIPHLNLKAECAMVPHIDANKFNDTNLHENNIIAKIELTDGWYSIDALLDLPLSKQLVAGKLYVGQKLRIWRAGLCGWAGPIPPLEASKTVALQLHINGTYRAHWADQLGFCKHHGSPLAFSCIKGAGGVVPSTLVGVTRIYPILYKERLADGGSVVRSEQMENKTLQLYNQRRSTIAEGVVSDFPNDIFSYCTDIENASEGEKIFKILESSAEPDVLMAEMSTEQLNSFATYQAKQKAIRESELQKKIEKALEDAGVSERQATQFIRKLELLEGHTYIVSGLIPLSSDSDTIYLQARGSTTTWQPLLPSASASFEPFFSPRKSVSLLSLGEVPLAREFDIAAVIVYVGKVTGHQNKQWVFVTDDSVSGSELQPEGSSNCLLAISFCSPIVDKKSIAPINYTLSGSTVGFSNLVKRARDQINRIWVAEATDNSSYSLYYELPCSSHLKEPVVSAQKWAKISSLVCTIIF